MLKKLENYYRQEGILSTEFNCKHLQECRGACGDFTEAKSAYAGKYYGKDAPRLLFISSDPGSSKTKGSSVDYSVPGNRTPEAVQAGVITRGEETMNGKIKKSLRFEGTNDLAFCILRAFNSNITQKAVLQYYAHINAAKCCMNKEGRKEADRILFKNCRGYLRGEIEIFSPQILVSHGGKARRGVKYALRGENITCKQNDFYICNLQNGNSFCWLQTPHPSSFGRAKFLQQKNDWDGYVEMMRQFIGETAGR